MTPITEELAKEWLLPFAILTGAPSLKGRALRDHAFVVAVICEGLPAELLDRNASIDAFRTWDTWPSPAAVWRFFSARHRGLNGRSLPAAGLGTPLSFGPAPPPVPAGAVGHPQSTPTHEPPGGRVKSGEQ